MQVVGFMRPPVCSGVYSAVNSRDAMRGFAGGFDGCEQGKARKGAVARGGHAPERPGRAAADVTRARETGVDAGGDIMIHGLPDGVRMEGDWTQGCIAVTDEEMDEIWGLVGEGTAIRIGE